MPRPLPFRHAALAHGALARLALAAALLAAPAAAQAPAGRDTIPAATLAPDSLAADSLAARLRAVEEALALLRATLAAQAEGELRSASRLPLELSGRVLTNAFHTDAATNNADVPLFVRPRSAEPAMPAGRGGVGATMRQTSLGLLVPVERVLGGTLVGELQVDFFGGQQPSSGGRHFPLPRLRTAHAALAWSRGALLAGQAPPLVAPLDPAGLASLGTPGFTAAGNLWLWLPQLRATAELGTPARLAVQAALLAPATGEPAAPFDTELDAAERAGRPALQLRLRTRWGEHDTAGEIGVGVHRGWLRGPDDRRLASEGVVVTALVPLPLARLAPAGWRAELRGEGYAGRALRGLGGGGIGQLLTAEGAAVRDRGGWAQLVVRPSSRWELGAGCGVADPRDADVPAGRLRNRACAAHALARPAGPLVAALELRRLATRYAGGTARARHVNLALGWEF